MTSPSTILILTAGVGDGHNAAARGLQGALESKGVVCRVEDPFQAAMPKVFAWMRSIYLWIIGYAPPIWRFLYLMGDRIDWQNSLISCPRPVECLIERIVDDCRPDLVVCTYMTYAYALERLGRRRGSHIKRLIVVTDSREISSSWLESHADAYAVADQDTADVLAERGLLKDRIFPLGFPVHPHVSSFHGAPPPDWRDGTPFRILLFPHGSARRAALSLSALMEASPHVCVTCVLGRHVRRYLAAFLTLKRRYGKRLKLVGWVRRVPQLMHDHHLIVGKAGGATVHEAMAIGRPMLVNHFVAGQEEGNMRALEEMGGGLFAGTPEGLRSALCSIMRDDGAAWSRMCAGLRSYPYACGAERTADLCLALIHSSSPPLSA